MLRICIFGAGAVGGHLAARLSVAGQDLSVVARGAHLEAMRSGTVTLLRGDEVVRGTVRASDDPRELGAQDFVFVTLKATALGAAAAGLAPLLGPDTGVVFAQNGIPWWYALGLQPSRPRPPDLSRLDPDGALASALPPACVIGGIVYSSNEVVEPGVIRNNTSGSNVVVVGETDDRQSPRVGVLRAALEAAGIGSPPVDDIRKSVWNKLLMNLAASPVTLLMEEGIAAVVADPALRELRERIQAEGRAIAAAHGIALDATVQRPGPPAKGASQHKTSMLQDYELGRPLEIEAILQAPLAFARIAGVATPALDAVVALAAHKAAARGLYQPLG